ncbi:unnamed protein product [Arctia plantaginis]|uniref:Lipase domain-containing protein n=1 Tax=Arctia plantaginis TaxID=874455 RepID=A0A8S0YP21_ARCPL|nr:unnamed protein product [Arctia plantaginis]
MEGMGRYVLIASVWLLLAIVQSAEKKIIMTTDEMENFINPDDLKIILDYYQQNSSMFNATQSITTTKRPVQSVGCFGVGGFMIRAINSLFSLNLRPSSSDDINTHFYFSSRKMNFRVQVFPGPQFGIESVDFDANRKTVMIVHGFMSYSGADWVINMTEAYLNWEDVNVIAVDWSGGSNTFKYWRAVANTRTVGRDIVTFMRQLKNATGLNFKNCHFIGHSLGAQIISFASYELGKVGRVTGLDPALPCFNTTNTKDRLDPSDADFVDVIHTNGKLSAFGFGFPYPTGHIDFYPNGGIRQPGCFSSKIPFYNTIDQAICSHGRAYILFTESLTNKNCSFRGSHWDLTVSGLKKSIAATCGTHNLSCPEMGIRAARNARGHFLVLTEEKIPYCVPDWQQHQPSPDLLEDITNYLQHLTDTTASNGAVTLSSIIPFSIAKVTKLVETTTNTGDIKATTSIRWYNRLFNYLFTKISHTEKISEDGNPEDS